MSDTEQLKEIVKTLKEMNRRLFYDNGGECLQSKVNRHNGFQKLIAKLIAPLYLLALALLFRMVYLWVT